MNGIASTFVGGVSPWANVYPVAAKKTEQTPIMKKPNLTPASKAPPPALPPIKSKKPPRVTGSRIDPCELVIASDPLPGVRLVTNKYWPVFAKMQPGQNIRCAPGDVQAISQALRKYIKVHNIKRGVLCRVLSQTTHPDGLGRVWLAEAEQGDK